MFPGNSGILLHNQRSSFCLPVNRLLFTVQNLIYMHEKERISTRYKTF
ncbi:hypothetical protein Chls_234 [Chlamydia suis]|uniref:Uncharacterized protein n=1 Tax=Chlamydia suis TaxID=83559 RepID=A0ABX6IPU5_9CHLA|nr:hypothetical protein Chls_234 [Chlamydia suis]